MTAISRATSRTTRAQAPNPSPLTPVRYVNRAPATLDRWIEAHANVVKEFNCGDGYGTESGFAYDILLRAGWRRGDDFVHTLIEPTVAAMLAQLRSVTQCDCDECKALLPSEGPAQ
ncbi:hypothetical protein E1N52_39225 [Paraburkholderia guartelaensis]|uniref:Uncharacterized protein n=1 Tax=Paraburkholderia guartelaensis TaxID=2546446 RepID=A0A4R5L4F3_9BURK|nr:hypothetical protein [Paraburkholderia guartelaensis]TDG02550.1 hypothetical protein E1N52_39225 [Paraburkholderia guartelaensis]